MTAKTTQAQEIESLKKENRELINQSLIEGDEHDKLVVMFSEIQQANDKLKTLEAENIKLKNSLDELEKENFRLNGALITPIASTIETRSIRADLLIALAPSINLSYPHGEAQRIQKAVDEIMGAWGVE